MSASAPWVRQSLSRPRGSDRCCAAGSVASRARSLRGLAVRDSLVICTAGRPNELERCLASVAFQTVLPDEILVVDASSDDVTAKLVDRLAATGDLPGLR